MANSFQESINKAKNIEQLCSAVRNNYPEKDKTEVVHLLEHLKHHDKILKMIAEGNSSEYKITNKFNIRDKFIELSKAKFKINAAGTKAYQPSTPIQSTSFQRSIEKTKNAEELIAFVKLQSATAHEGLVVEDAMKRVINAKPDQLLKFAEKGETPFLIPEENGIKAKLQFFAKEKLAHFGQQPAKVAKYK